MIKENQKYLNRFHVVLDALVIYCSFCLSYYIRYICPLFKVIFPRFGYWRQLWQYQGILLVRFLYTLFYMQSLIYINQKDFKIGLQSMRISLRRIPLEWFSSLYI